MNTESNFQSKIEQAIVILKNELPSLFIKDISYDIYDPEIVFQDPISSFKTKFNYRIIFWTLRFHGQLFFKEIYFDLHNVEQTESNIIKAEWTVRGILRLWYQPKIFFNGYSIYKFNSQGLIHEHIDNWDRSPGEILRQFFP